MLLDGGAGQEVLVVKPAKWLQWTCWPPPTCLSLCSYHATKLPSQVCWIWQGVEGLNTNWDFSHRLCCFAPWALETVTPLTLPNLWAGKPLWIALCIVAVHPKHTAYQVNITGQMGTKSHKSPSSSCLMGRKKKNRSTVKRQQNA